MARLTIRNLDDALMSQLHARAAAHHRSIEEEAGCILRAELEEIERGSEGLLHRIRQRFAGLGDIQLAMEPRHPNVS